MKWVRRRSHEVTTTRIISSDKSFALSMKSYESEKSLKVGDIPILYFTVSQDNQRNDEILIAYLYITKANNVNRKNNNNEQTEAPNGYFDYCKVCSIHNDVSPHLSSLIVNDHKIQENNMHINLKISYTDEYANRKSALPTKCRLQPHFETSRSKIKLIK